MSKEEEKKNKINQSSQEASKAESNSKTGQTTSTSKESKSEEGKKVLSKDQTTDSKESKVVSEDQTTDNKDLKTTNEKDQASQSDISTPKDSQKGESSPDKTLVSTQKETPKNDNTEKKQNVQSDNSIQLNGLLAFKMSMTTFYNEKGESVPVTALRYEPCYVSQIKTKEKESYEAVQVAFQAQKNKRCSKARINHLKPAGFKEGARFVREIRQKVPEGIKIGQKLSIDSLKKGDLVKVSSISKGKGFTGVMKRWNFSGGRATHGSKSHRGTGSIGQHTEPARVFPGRKMPGHHGFSKVSRLKVSVIDVLPEEGMIFVKGPVPGARNTLVSLTKM